MCTCGAANTNTMRVRVSCWVRDSWQERIFRRYQSGQLAVFSGANAMVALQYVYIWLILQVCGHSGPTCIHGNPVLPILVVRTTSNLGLLAVGHGPQ